MICVPVIVPVHPWYTPGTPPVHPFWAILVEGILRYIKKKSRGNLCFGAIYIFFPNR